jgi:hypothetical protein
MRKHGLNGVIRALLVYGLYILFVVAALNYLEVTGYWRQVDGVNRVIQRVAGNRESVRSTKRQPPNLWERPTIVTFKITPATKIDIGYGGIRCDENRERLRDSSGEVLDKEPLHESGSYVDLIPGQAVCIVITDYWSHTANDISLERLVGIHEGEVSKPENILGGPGWANNITFSGWVVSATRSAVTVRYP